jgi:hypothetical protein
MSDLGDSAPSKYNVVSYSLIVHHYMFRPKWPSSGAQVVVVHDSAARCNAAESFSTTPEHLNTVI